MNISDLALDYCGLMRLDFAGGGNWLGALWSRAKYGKLLPVVRDAALYFERQMGRRAQFAYVRRLPNGVEDGYAFALDGDEVVLLFAADWMPEGFVFVCAMMAQ